MAATASGLSTLATTRSFPLHCMLGHDIDVEDSFDEGCPVQSVSFVFLRLALSFGEHVEDVPIVQQTCGLPGLAFRRW